MAKKKKQPNFPSLLPIVKRVSAKLIGFDLVNVQAMSTPKGELFYFDIWDDEKRKELLKAKLDTLITGEIPEKFKEKNNENN